jgi:hypothetical protein
MDPWSIRKLHVLMNVNQKYLYFYNPALMAVRAGYSGHILCVLNAA